jgi:hypothetical protein
MKDKLIEILSQYDKGIIDALNFRSVSDMMLVVNTETRDRLNDVMNILLKYDEEEYGNDEFLNSVTVILDAKRNQVEFFKREEYWK